MASIEKISERIFREDDAWKKLLIGGALVLSILGIPVAFGYLFAYAFNLQKRSDAPLPEWDQWRRMFFVGWHALAAFILWLGGPVVAAWLLTILFGLASAIFLAVGWLAMGIAYVAGLTMFTAALIHYQREQELRSLIDVEEIFVPIERHWKALVLPGIAWYGLMMIGRPLLPFTFFLGMVLYLAYAIPLLSQTKGERPTF